MRTLDGWNRREFLQATTLAAGSLAGMSWAGQAKPDTKADLAQLPAGNAPKPVPYPHFPDRLHAFVWRNWPLAPLGRIAAVVGATKADILRLGRSMGLPKPPRISNDQWRRSYLTVIKHNWHLIPYEQLLELLGWTPAQLAFTLREDDFLYIKLGSHKPACSPIRYAAPDEAATQRVRQLARWLKEEFPQGLEQPGESLFAFVRDLSTPPPRGEPAPGTARNQFAPRYCYSYFALYGDPLLEPEAEPYPEGYLARLAAAGVDGVWLQAVLYKLAPFPWQPELSARHVERLKHLRALVQRARKHGIGLWLYLNEPRAMPLRFFEARPHLKGAVEGDHAALCTSHPEVQRYIQDAIASICRAVPELAGFFTITASENFTNCWSHHQGAGCPRCGKRPPGDVIAEVNRLINAGIQSAMSSRAVAAKGATAGSRAPRLIAWDWGWQDAWADTIIRQLPEEVALMSVSEWSLPIERGGIKSTVGEYSISSVGPGPRAQKHWALARQRGLRTMAKVQAGNTWELSAVPYIPALENVARHAANLRNAQVDGLMLGWTLGGYPSPNLEVVAELGSSSSLTVEQALTRVAERRFGNAVGPFVVTAWREFSAAFSEFPYAGGLVYSAPLQLGPANLLWAERTGFTASMVGFPYDDLDGWRSVYPPEVFAGQFEKVAAGFETALARLRESVKGHGHEATDVQRGHLERESSVAEAAAIHFRSVANQARFLLARGALQTSKPEGTQREAVLGEIRTLLRAELGLAKRLWALQLQDSRLGFEASNQYYYVPQDLVEKVLNCRDLLERMIL